jgi:hypothetical protein
MRLDPVCPSPLRSLMEARHIAAGGVYARPAPFIVSLILQKYFYGKSRLLFMPVYFLAILALRVCNCTK